MHIELFMCVIIAYSVINANYIVITSTNSIKFRIIINDYCIY
jgi:hypothetical protein